MKYQIIAIDKETNEILEETERDSFTSAMIYCAVNSSDDIECLLKEITSPK